jgi:exodeoxyribonuclease VII small subunit
VNSREANASEANLRESAHTIASPREPQPNDRELPRIVASGDARWLLIPSLPDPFGPAMAKTPESPASFEAALAELERIVATMEGGQLPLKESLAAYQRGALLLQYCQGALKDARQQVEVLEKGVLKAFDADAAANGEP